MKTLIIKNQWKKILALTALTLAPALALTGSAQASPSHRAPVAQYSNNWNDPRNQSPRYENRSNQGQWGQNSRFDNRQNQGRYDNNYGYSQPRFDDHRSDTRFNDRRDYNRGRSNGNDTGKIIGAGIVGAILGAVLSH